MWGLIIKLIRRLGRSRKILCRFTKNHLVLILLTGRLFSVVSHKIDGFQLAFHLKRLSSIPANLIPKNDFLESILRCSHGYSIDCFYSWFSYQILFWLFLGREVQQKRQMQWWILFCWLRKFLLRFRPLQIVYWNCWRIKI